MKIIKFRKKDQKKVEKLIRDILFEIFGGHELSPFEKFEIYSKGKGIFLIAIEKEKIIATMALKRESKKVGRIKRMYVKKSFRNKGVAHKLYKKIEEFAKKENLIKLTLSTTPQMKSAIKFYRERGFMKIKDNKRLNQIFFEKKLK